LWSYFADAWIAIWRNIVDAYHSDRIVKFVVWLGVAIAAAYGTLAGAALLLRVVSIPIEFVGEQAADFRRARSQSPSDSDLVATGSAKAPEFRQAARRKGLLSLGLVLGGLAAIAVAIVALH
jgi:hypothetical protein